MARNSNSHASHRSNGRSTARASTRAPSRAAAAAQQRHYLRATAACGTLSLITGAAVGAVLMYAFDPKAGLQRRQRAYDSARQAMDSTSDALGNAYHQTSDAVGHFAGHAFDHLSRHASDAASAISSAVPSAADIPSTQEASDAGHQLFNRAADKAAAYRDAVHRRYHALRDAARSMIPQRRRPTDVSMWSTGALVAGALATGLGAMWLFDPSRGRGRRAWIVQKGNRAVHETGHFMRATGTHLRNKATGYAHEAASMVSDSDLVASAHDTLDTLGEYASSIKVAAQDGYVRLTGRAPTDIINDVLDAIHRLRGVVGIKNEMEVTDMQPSENPQTTDVSA